MHGAQEPIGVATAPDRHRGGVLTMAFSLSARRGEPVPWSLALDEPPAGD
jgi:hypothetical protein